ncbi:MAG: phosphate ABC transporter permease subunit PstC, partial [Acidobacteriota bacterium]|nr:phosphate ABC transporter permease subunit PstC [Acidobacteriota bacterium]
MKNTGKVGNKIFRSGSTAAAVTILVTLAAVAAFLIIQAWPAISDPSVRVRTVGSSDQLNIWQFTAPQIFGTVLAAFLAMLLAVPLSIGIALFISHYAPKRLSQGLGYLVDLLAAIPSVVYGLWGAMWL